MYGNYITPSQSAIYIGEYHVDDCYSIEWNYRDNRNPLYSYFNDEVVSTSLGKKIVVGSLSINYRYPGYLPWAIKEARSISLSGSIDVKQIHQDGRNFVDTYLTEMKNGTAAERMKLLLAAAIVGPKALNRMSALAYLSQQGLSLGLRGVDSQQEFPDVFDIQNPDLDVVPVDIWTHFGDIDETHVAEKIEGAVFIGESRQVQAGASASGGLSASGINLLEVYSFWAKKVTKFRFEGGTLDKRS
jgi:hypothetical protein